MNGWAVAGLAAAGLACWVGAETWAERRRQRRSAAERTATDEFAFCAQMLAGGAAEETALWLWHKVLPYYFQPLTPYASDRPYSQVRIDGDDIADWLSDYERDFRIKLQSEQNEWPLDPTLIELALAIERARS